MYAYAQPGPSATVTTGTGPPLHYPTTPPQSAPSPSYYHHPSFYHPHHLNNHQLGPSSSPLNNPILNNVLPSQSNLLDHQQHNPYLIHHHSLTPPHQTQQQVSQPAFHHQPSPTMPSSPVALGASNPGLMPPQHHHSIHNLHHHIEPQLTELTPQTKRRR